MNSWRNSTKPIVFSTPLLSRSRSFASSQPCSSWTNAAKAIHQSSLSRSLNGSADRHAAEPLWWDEDWSWRACTIPTDRKSPMTRSENSSTKPSRTMLSLADLVQVIAL